MASHTLVPRVREGQCLGTVALCFCELNGGEVGQTERANTRESDCMSMVRWFEWRMCLKLLPPSFASETPLHGWTASGPVSQQKRHGLFATVIRRPQSAALSLLVNSFSYCVHSRHVRKGIPGGRTDHILILQTLRVNADCLRIHFLLHEFRALTQHMQA